MFFQGGRKMIYQEHFNVSKYEYFICCVDIIYTMN